MNGRERLRQVHDEILEEQRRAERRAARFERKQRLQRYLRRQGEYLIFGLIAAAVLAILGVSFWSWALGYILLIVMTLTWDQYDERIMLLQREIERAAWQHERDVETMLDLSHAVDVEIHNRWKAENGLDREAILWEGQTGTGQIVDRG